jgi:propionate CoA-transferase
MKALTPSQAAELVADGQTLACAGFVGAGHAEAVTRALETRFLAQGHPRDLTLVYAAGQGDRLRRGVNHFGHEGMVRRIIGGHWISAPRLGALVNADRVEAWNLPQGVIAHLFRAIAGGNPGVVTRIGLHTFVDPRYDGARLTPRSASSAFEPRVKRIDIAGEELLFYPSFPIDVALIRATTADARGNLSCEHEPFHQDMLAIAQAARNSGGTVIAQVKRIVAAGALDPNAVRVPGILVDHLVIADDEADHWMTFGERLNLAYTGHGPRPKDSDASLPMGLRKIVQRRALLELIQRPDAVVNLGVGMPAGVGAVAREEGYDRFTLTVESGPIGGTPAEGLSFGASAYPQAIIDQAAMFDFYDGGGLDIAILGLAEFDAQGNVNVSRFGAKLAGVGGFINISQSARCVVFVGSFTAGGLEIACGDGRLCIVREGRTRKLVRQVQQLSFNGAYVAALGRRVCYVTERAVFELRDGALTITEVAPGIDMEREVLAQLDFPVAVAQDVKPMDERIFFDRPMLGGQCAP